MEECDELTKCRKQTNAALQFTEMKESGGRRQGMNMCVEGRRETRIVVNVTERVTSLRSAWNKQLQLFNFGRCKRDEEENK